MKLTFSKTLLATAVMLGLTACSSGGGGGSNEPTTSSANNTASITVPNIDTNNSNTVNNSANSMQPNATVPSITPSTFKVASDGYATGKATYASAISSIRLDADFDNRTISGSAVGKIDDQNVNIALNNATLYKTSSKYNIYGNYASYDERYNFEGNASAIHNQEKFSGRYGGVIYGESSPFSEMRVEYKVTSENDSTRVISELEEYESRPWTGQTTLYRQ